jgi:hypothetical protein
MELRLRDDGRYDFVDEKGEVTPVSLHRLADNRFVAQAEIASGDNFKGYGYLVLDIKGDEVLAYAADCNKQDQERMQSIGVEVRRYECKIDRVADPLAFFVGLAFDPPTSKLVRK